MSNLSRDIEAYIKRLLAEGDNGMLEIQRSLLSDYFSCVPSQINYVLSTRFTLANGYLVETRRGGGGYMRITTIPLESHADIDALMQQVGDALNESDSERMLTYLENEELISSETAGLLQAILKNRVLKMTEQMTVNEMRAHFMLQILSLLAIGMQKLPPDADME